MDEDVDLRLKKVQLQSIRLTISSDARISNPCTQSGPILRNSNQTRVEHNIEIEKSMKKIIKQYP